MNSIDGVLEDMVDTLAKTFKEVTGDNLSLMRRGKIVSELFWATSKKD